MLFTEWATGTPANEGDKCIVMSYRLSNDYEWSDVGCNQPLNFMCESCKFQPDLNMVLNYISVYYDIK